MAVVISTLTNCIAYINSLYELDSTPPTSGEEDFIVWTALLNVAINLWEAEEGMLWQELFVKLADASTGADTTTTAGDYSYAVPTAFRFPASGYVWLGSGTNKTAYKVIKQEDLTLYENNSDNWCYFLLDASPTLEFNPNLTLTTGSTISYNYYKKATALSSGSDVLEMSDPMFAVFYALSVLKSEEGDTVSASIASQKMEGMKTKNMLPAWFQEDSANTRQGFGV